ncbi:hypothetical protein WA026_005438 [Henosepilachna vigintioctopunctata]|uniref:Circadian clock-controlled protein-like n=1 Tax=Henosepilachna vigintioctopunctata TaxID=420089 RepID=A0AAW1U2U0_9CUCU
MTSKKLCVFLLLSIVYVESKDLPKYLKDLRCSKSSKDLYDCFLKNGNIAIPLVAKGDPEYNIPKMNPMEIPFVQLISSPTLNINITKVKVHGLDKLKLVDIKLIIDKGLYTHIFKGESVVIEGEYTADGHILVMPVKGHGHFKMNLKNGVYKATNLLDTYEKDNEEWWKVRESKLDYAFDKIEFDLDNLFEGNKDLGATINKFLNENWDLLVVDFGPGIAKTISNLYKNIFDQFCAQIPAKNFFLD